MSQKKLTAKILALTFISATVLQGCGDTTMLRLIGELSSKASGSTQRVAAFYKNLNGLHGQMRTEELQIQDAAATELDPATPGPISTVTDAEIKHRVQSARFLETYCLKVDSLANAKNTNEMNNAISDINKDYSLVDGLKNFNLIEGLKAGATPVTTSLKIIGRRSFSIWVNKKLKEALNQSEKVFQEQAKTLKEETNADIEEAKTRATKLLGLAERAYRKLKTNHASDKDISDCSKSIERATALRQSATSDNPSELYGGLLDCHQQLMNHISTEPNQGKKP